VKKTKLIYNNGDGDDGDDHHSDYGDNHINDDFT